MSSRRIEADAEDEGYIGRIERELTDTRAQRDCLQTALGNEQAYTKKIESRVLTLRRERQDARAEADLGLLRDLPGSIEKMRTITKQFEARAAPMTPHDHRTFVAGCYRCELGRDETMSCLVEERDELEAEVRRLRALLREVAESWLLTLQRERDHRAEVQHLREALDG